MRECEGESESAGECESQREHLLSVHARCGNSAKHSEIFKRTNTSIEDYELVQTRGTNTATRPITTAQRRIWIWRSRSRVGRRPVRYSQLPHWALEKANRSGKCGLSDMPLKKRGGWIVSGEVAQPLPGTFELSVCPLPLP